jgi:hypothetical protein
MSVTTALTIPSETPLGLYLQPNRPQTNLFESRADLLPRRLIVPQPSIQTQNLQKLIQHNFLGFFGQKFFGPLIYEKLISFYRQFRVAYKDEPDGKNANNFGFFVKDFLYQLFLLFQDGSGAEGRVVIDGKSLLGSELIQSGLCPFSPPPKSDDKNDEKFDQNDTSIPTHPTTHDIPLLLSTMLLETISQFINDLCLGNSNEGKKVDQTIEKKIDALFTSTEIDYSFIYEVQYWLLHIAHFTPYIAFLQHSTRQISDDSNETNFAKVSQQFLSFLLPFLTNSLTTQYLDAYRYHLTVDLRDGSDLTDSYSKNGNESGSGQNIQNMQDIAIPFEKNQLVEYFSNLYLPPDFAVRIFDIYRPNSFYIITGDGKSNGPNFLQFINEQNIQNNQISLKKIYFNLFQKLKFNILKKFHIFQNDLQTKSEQTQLFSKLFPHTKNIVQLITIIYTLHQAQFCQTSPQSKAVSRLLSSLWLTSLRHITHSHFYSIFHWGEFLENNQSNQSNQSNQTDSKSDHKNDQRSENYFTVFGDDRHAIGPMYGPHLTSHMLPGTNNDDNTNDIKSSQDSDTKYSSKCVISHISELLDEYTIFIQNEDLGEKNEYNLLQISVPNLQIMTTLTSVLPDGGFIRNHSTSIGNENELSLTFSLIQQFNSCFNTILENQHTKSEMSSNTTKKTYKTTLSIIDAIKQLVHKSFLFILEALPQVEETQDGSNRSGDDFPMNDAQPKHNFLSPFLALFEPILSHQDNPRFVSNLLEGLLYTRLRVDIDPLQHWGEAAERGTDDDKNNKNEFEQYKLELEKNNYYTFSNQIPICYQVQPYTNINNQGYNDIVHRKNDQTEATIFLKLSKLLYSLVEKVFVPLMDQFNISSYIIEFISSQNNDQSKEDRSKLQTNLIKLRFLTTIILLFSTTSHRPQNFSATMSALMGFFFQLEFEYEKEVKISQFESKTQIQADQIDNNSDVNTQNVVNNGGVYIPFQIRLSKNYPKFLPNNISGRNDDKIDENSHFLTIHLNLLDYLTLIRAADLTQIMITQYEAFVSKTRLKYANSIQKLKRNLVNPDHFLQNDTAFHSENQNYSNFFNFEMFDAFNIFSKYQIDHNKEKLLTLLFIYPSRLNFTRMVKLFFKHGVNLLTVPHISSLSAKFLGDKNSPNSNFEGENNPKDCFKNKNNLLTQLCLANLPPNIFKELFDDLTQSTAITNMHQITAFSNKLIISIDGLDDLSQIEQTVEVVIISELFFKFKTTFFTFLNNLSSIFAILTGTDGYNYPLLFHLLYFNNGAVLVHKIHQLFLNFVGFNQNGKNKSNHFDNLRTNFEILEKKIQNRINKVQNEIVPSQAGKNTKINSQGFEICLKLKKQLQCYEEKTFVQFQTTTKSLRDRLNTLLNTDIPSYIQHVPDNYSDWYHGLIMQSGEVNMGDDYNPQLYFSNPSKLRLKNDQIGTTPIHTFLSTLNTQDLSSMDSLNQLITTDFSLIFQNLQNVGQTQHLICYEPYYFSEKGEKGEDGDKNPILYRGYTLRDYMSTLSRSSLVSLSLLLDPSIQTQLHRIFSRLEGGSNTVTKEEYSVQLKIREKMAQIEKNINILIELNPFWVFGNEHKIQKQVGELIHFSNNLNNSSTISMGYDEGIGMNGQKSDINHVNIQNDVILEENEEMGDQIDSNTQGDDRVGEENHSENEQNNKNQNGPKKLTQSDLFQETTLNTWLYHNGKSLLPFIRHLFDVTISEYSLPEIELLGHNGQKMDAQDDQGNSKNDHKIKINQFFESTSITLSSLQNLLPFSNLRIINDNGINRRVTNTTFGNYTDIVKGSVTFKEKTVFSMNNNIFGLSRLIFQIYEQLFEQNCLNCTLLPILIENYSDKNDNKVKSVHITQDPTQVVDYNLNSLDGDGKCTNNLTNYTFLTPQIKDTSLLLSTIASFLPMELYQYAISQCLAFSIKKQNYFFKNKKIDQNDRKDQNNGQKIATASTKATISDWFDGEFQSLLSATRVIYQFMDKLLSMYDSKRFVLKINNNENNIEKNIEKNPQNNFSYYILPQHIQPIVTCLIGCKCIEYLSQYDNNMASFNNIHTNPHYTPDAIINIKSALLKPFTLLQNNFSPQFANLCQHLFDSQISVLFNPYNNYNNVNNNEFGVDDEVVINV